MCKNSRMSRRYLRIHKFNVAYSRIYLAVSAEYFTWTGFCYGWVRQRREEEGKETVRGKYEELLFRIVLHAGFETVSKMYKIYVYGDASGAFADMCACLEFAFT